MLHWIRVITCFLLFSEGSRAAESFEDQLVFFEKKIRPVLAEKCYSCHSADAEKLKAHLQVDHREHILAGGDTGAAMVPGKPAVSLLVEALSYENPDMQMPPKARLGAAIVADFTKWIADGAAWPDEPVPKRGSEGKVTPFDLTKRHEEHWSWREITRPVPPVVQNTGRVASPIDQFILAKVEAANLKPAAPADKNTLIRRIYFDLIGLPPTPDQIATFLADESPQAYEKVVEELLGSPRFGEKWARHWMDLVRYAETYGHEFDYPIDYAFEYRDYLIRAFNADLPYDQFVTEHIAGDLIENPRRNPDEQFNESILGTGFWYFHEATHAPTDVLQDEADHMDNQIDVFGKSFLGLTVACARCHDHKFDAISTADYYALSTYLQCSCRQEIPMDPGKAREHASARLDELRTRGNAVVKQIAVGTVEANLPGKYFLAAAELMKEELVNPIQDDPWKGIVFDDFESGNFDKWKITGDAFGTEPAPGKFGAQKLTGDFGKGLANSYHGSDDLTGTLTSEPFTIGKPFINFLIAGGNHKETSFELWIEGRKIAEAQGKKSDELEARTWNVSSRIGQRGELRVIDNARGGWGHIEVDRIVFSDAPAVKSNSLPIPDARKIADFAEKQGLDKDLLTAWTRVFATESKDPKAPAVFFASLLGDSTGYSPPSYPVVSARIAAEREKISNQIAGFEKESTLFASFRDGEIPEGWSTSGLAFQSPAKSAGLSFDKMEPFALPGVLSSSRNGPGQDGTLRSPTFEIATNRIFVKAKSKDLFARLVIDNYHMAKFSGLLFGGTIEKNVTSDGEFRWFSFNPGKYLGHRAFFEFVDKGGAIAEIEEIRFGDGGSPPAEIHPVVLAAANSATSIEDMAANLDRAWKSSSQKLIEGTAGRADADLLNWMAANGLFEMKTLSPELAGILTEGQGLQKSLPPERFALAMAEGSAEDGHVYIRGSYRNLGETVSRRFLTALGGKEGDRLELARQVVSPENPLTSRVLVNRIWHHLFGRGIVPSVDDFGPMGKLPSHPELLDWLASDFTSHGWSIKRMIRQIVLTNTYQQDSVANPEIDKDLLATADPNNILLHRMSIRRLPAESIRDAVLAVSGRLDVKAFGPSVPTYRTKFMSGRGARGSGPLDGDGRRSIYQAVYRNFLSPLMLTFDQPGPFGPKGQRSVSNVPAQALALMNDPFVIEQAKLWVNGDKKTYASPEDRIREMYQKALGTKPSLDRIKVLKTFLDQQAGAYGATDERAWADLGHTLFNLKDFVYLK